MKVSPAVRAGVPAVTVLLAVLLASCAGPSAPVASRTPSPSTTPSDIRQLSTIDDVDPVGWHKGNRAQGFLTFTLTSAGICASIMNGTWDRERFFLWPAGYRVAGGSPLVVVDPRGRFVASDGDYVWVKGWSTTVPRGMRHSACPAQRGEVFRVVAHSKPGTPFGYDHRPVMVMNGCGVDPAVRPRELTLACDGGLTLHAIHWDTWGRQGASGTATATMHCYDPMGADSMPVSFTYGKALHDPQDQHGLILLEGVQIDYPREPCAG